MDAPSTWDDIGQFTEKRNKGDSSVHLYLILSNKYFPCDHGKTSQEVSSRSQVLKIIRMVHRNKVGQYVSKLNTFIYILETEIQKSRVEVTTILQKIIDDATKVSAKFDNNSKLFQNLIENNA